MGSKCRLVIVLLGATLAAAAQSADLKALLAEALDHNPEIGAARRRWEAARNVPAQASSLPDPMFSPAYSSAGRPWPGAGLGKEPTSSIGFMVSQEVPAPGKRRLMGAMAGKEAEAEFEAFQ